MSDPSSLVPSWNEQDRLKAVDSYHILDTPKEEEFDDIVKMAAEACAAPISLISFVTTHRQWFKAEVGTGLSETPLPLSICAHAILQPDLFVVPDTTKDVRFATNPLVTGDPNIRFYAGMVLTSPEGLPLGTLCVLDYQPRTLSKEQAARLKILARQVMAQLELRRTMSQLRRALEARHRSEEELTVALEAKTKSEERLSLALNASGFVGTWEWDIARDRVFADPQFVSVFGGQPHWSVEGAPIAEYVKAIHPDDLARVKSSIEQALTRDAVFRDEYRLVQKDGSIVWIEARGKCLFDAADKPVRFPGAAVDITLRKKSEQIALEAAARFKFMAEAMPQKIWTATPEGKVDFFNRQWMEFTGLTFEEIRDWGWNKFVHPDDREETDRIYKNAVAEGKPFEMQQRFRRKDGEYRWHLARGAPMRDGSDKVTMWMGSNTDVHDQRMENEHLEALVKQRTQRLSDTVNELEAFSYSISHDMRAPLRAMIGFSNILREDHSANLDADGLDYLSRIAGASKRMDRLIQDVLQFSRLTREEAVFTAIDTDATVREIIRSYPNLADGVVTITIRSTLHPILGNEALLTQCVSNLLENGVKFVADGRKPRIEVWSEKVSGRVKLSFQDNGIGISPHNLERIFEIFHRVGRDGDGTGIGLAIVRKAANKMDGTVGVSSEPGQGSVFWLDLKAA